MIEIEEFVRQHRSTLSMRLYAVLGGLMLYGSALLMCNFIGV